ncbi:hypothetical protein B0H13DRAFT_2341582 [Mycena leptocephala]|nr:hypothetical protein B0H13DRAFT_2341582 [Mycena leptocephala]
MALARLSSMPLELQYRASKELGPSDLLALSHVSTYWRAFVLSDKRWAEWSALIASSDDTLEQVLTRFNILDMFPKRQLVYLWLCDSCTVCGEYAEDIFLPHMKRVCEACLPGDEFAVLQFNTALAKYDLRERQLDSVLTLEWRDPNKNGRRTVKLVSESRVKEIAIRNYGSETYLLQHLERKKADAKSTYSSRSQDYRSAASARDALTEKGNLAAADAVVLARTGRKIPKAFPTYPPILLPARPVDRRVVCFRPQSLIEVGGEVMCDADDSDGSQSVSGSEA